MARGRRSGMAPGQTWWQCSFEPDGDPYAVGSPGPNISATNARHAYSLFRIDLSGEQRPGTIIVRDAKGVERLRERWIPAKRTP